MKKYTHPKKNNALTISRNGATNFTNIYTNNFFTNTPFDIREHIDLVLNENEETNVKELQITTFINEYKFNSSVIWNNFNK